MPGRTRRFWESEIYSKLELEFFKLSFSPRFLTALRVNSDQALVRHQPVTLGISDVVSGILLAFQLVSITAESHAILI